jgi:hypothetical protein
MITRNFCFVFYNNKTNHTTENCYLKHKFFSRYKFRTQLNNVSTTERKKSNQTNFTIEANSLMFTTRKQWFTGGHKPSISGKIRHKVKIYWRLCDGQISSVNSSWKSYWRLRSSQTLGRNFVTAQVVTKWEWSLFWQPFSDGLGRHKIRHKVFLKNKYFNCFINYFSKKKLLIILKNVWKTY